MGYCETADQLARMSADVIRYVLAKYYIQSHYSATGDWRSEAKALLEAIINKGTYSESMPILGVDNITIIPYQEVVILYQEMSYN